jgi:hypothetical protein
MQPSAPAGFQESRLGQIPIRELGLALPGSPLEPLIAQVRAELAAAGLAALEPRFYLSTEWGVPFETIAVAIPFYLARPDLAELHAERTGLVEGFDPDDILRYLRHELGHVVNYAYKLYERPAWIETFGAITQPYLEEYRPEPWSPRYVRHLPGWYAQKHPDEDWAETFAVWLTPGHDWRADYAVWPVALAKLERCDAIMAGLRGQPPLVTDDELDEDVGEIEYSLDDLYEELAPEAPELPPGLDGSLRSIFVELPRGESWQPASHLIAASTRALSRAVFTWTGHFPEHTHRLLHHLAARAEALGLRYPDGHERAATLALAAFVTSLAMNHVHRGSYLP